MRSYSEQLLHWRADRLCSAFPRYDQSMLRAWAKHMPDAASTSSRRTRGTSGKRGPTPASERRGEPALL
eukprot:CAMPEP_0198544408 /NCGR_PEP_ID=MMETSP1462-20131121/60809_1 /TAXON_ID=1333877 /ORGANISM="Brandtodinium nutriculum, Strain RCC3387" /LENGTH=68 /DNA_ID=CAMNT_0044274747 /DNA_START=9 /DNA_END=216 /DNA_ORIENTATION=+